MIPSFFDERARRAIFCGRLALALAGQRAEKCANRRCARARHCLAEWSANIHQPVGDCPNMTLAEWRAVGHGLSRVSEALLPWHKTQDEKRQAELDALPKAERMRRIEAMEELERWKDEQRARLRIELTYWEYLWVEPGPDRLVIPTHTAADEKRLIAAAIAMGCRCAREGMVEDCKRCDGT
jgi:hypothetical protein